MARVNPTITSRVGKKFALYLPKKIVDLLEIKEGEKVKMSVEKGKIVVEIIRNPLDLALHGKKFARISAREVEQISLEEQKKHEGFA